jgi:hypothetical protein
MSGPQRNPDKLNTIGVVVVGICGAVLVYVTIVALQAFYMDDTSEIQTMADYGGQDTFAKSIRSTQEGAIKEYAPNGAVADPKQQTYRIAIDEAMKKVAVEAKKDPSNLVPMVGKSDAPTVLPVFGRPKAIPGAAPPAGADRRQRGADGAHRWHRCGWQPAARQRGQCHQSGYRQPAARRLGRSDRHRLGRAGSEAAGREATGQETAGTTCGWLGFQ